MFESYYGFTSAPFALNPDPGFYFASKGHSRALSYLQYGVYQREGFIVVTGEIGSGKTTLVRTLLQGLNPADIVAAQISNTQLDSNELLHAICQAFGIPVAGYTKSYLLGALENFLTSVAAQGRRALLVVDEAQNLGLREMEELRMLSNYQFEDHALLQSFLVGQPELRQLLKSVALEQLRQRIIASCHLGPLSPAEVRSYVEHRLAQVGWKGDDPSVSDGAFVAIHRHSGGIPRRINLLCTRVLLATWLAEARVIDEEAVEVAADEMRSETFTDEEPPTVGQAPAGPVLVKKLP